MNKILEQTYEAWNKGIIEFEDYLRQIIVLNHKKKQEEEAEKKAFMDDFMSDLEERL